MTRSLLQPLRTRRVIHTVPVQPNDSGGKAPAMTPGTRKTLAVIGSLWVSFATSAPATPAPSSSPARVNPPAPAMDSVARGCPGVENGGLRADWHHADGPNSPAQ